MLAWQDISTAPKDRMVRVKLQGPYICEEVTMRWRPNGGWLVYDDGTLKRATHWKPYEERDIVDPPAPTPRWWRTLLPVLKPQPAPEDKRKHPDYAMYWHPGAGWTHNRP
jgi:hypothetical protein